MCRVFLGRFEADPSGGVRITGPAINPADQKELAELGLKLDGTIRLKSAIRVVERSKHGGLSLTEFMKGYGTSALNDPRNLWDNEVLAAHAATLTMTLMYLFLSGVMALFLAALIVEIGTR